MIQRLLKGLILGLVMGGLVAAALVKGLGMNPAFSLAGGGLVAYTAALIVGAAVGLVAGKPIWAHGAWIEALLKTFFGALLAAGGMFALQKFATFGLDLTAFGGGQGRAGDLAFVALPAIATVLSVFFEIDNTDSGEGAPSKEEAKAGAKKSGAAGGAAKLRAPTSSRKAAEALDDDEPVAAKQLKK